MVAFDQIMKRREFLVLLRESVWLHPPATPLVRVAKRIHPVAMTNDPIVHDLSVVTDGESVGVVHRTTLPDEKVTFFDAELTKDVLHRRLSDGTVTEGVSICEECVCVCVCE